MAWRQLGVRGRDKKRSDMTMASFAGASSRRFFGRGLIFFRVAPEKFIPGCTLPLIGIKAQLYG
jgi:hypothetical protein